MTLYDAEQHRAVALEECVVLDPIDERLCPLRFPDGRWVLFEHFGGDLLALEDVPRGTSAVAQLRAAAYDLHERIVGRVEAMRLLDEEPYRSGGSNGFEAIPLLRARALARADGYTEAEIDHALATIDERITPDRVPEDPLDEGIHDKHILKAIFMAGAGGAGKSFIAGEAFAGEGLKFVNADKHLERLLAQHDIPLEKAGSRYDLFRHARDVKEKEQTLYSGRRLGMVIDTTGWEYNRIAKPEQRLSDLGYDTYMIFVTTSLDTALRRNEERGNQGGRRVPDSFVIDAWEGAHQNIGRYRKLFGKRFFIVDNDNDLPPRQAEKVLLPAVRRIANRILRAPLKNPKGKKWLERGAHPDIFPPPEPKKPKDKKAKGKGAKKAPPPKTYTAPSPEPQKGPDALKAALARHNTKMKKPDREMQQKIDFTFPKGKPNFHF